MKSTELKTLRRLIDENIDEIIDTMIDADIANMEAPDMHYTHAVRVHLCLADDIRIYNETLRKPAYTGAYESRSWIIYVSDMGGDDLADRLMFSEISLPDDDDPNCYTKRDEAIEQAMDDYREYAIHDNIYSDELSAAMDELNAEIAQAEYDEAPKYWLTGDSENLLKRVEQKKGRRYTYYECNEITSEEAHELLDEWRALLDDPDLTFERLWIGDND